MCCLVRFAAAACVKLRAKLTTFQSGETSTRMIVPTKNCSNSLMANLPRRCVQHQQPRADPRSSFFQGCIPIRRRRSLSAFQVHVRWHKMLEGIIRSAEDFPQEAVLQFRWITAMSRLLLR